MKTIQTAILSIVLVGNSSLRAGDLPADINALLDCSGKSISRAEVEAENLKLLARAAISADADTAKHAIEQLRAKGPAGLQALLGEHAELLKTPQPITLPTGRALPNEQLERFKAALDAVGQQRDCYASKLYWFTDLEQAKAAAKASSKPILSLRLLGKLDEEFSCANSRFFRTTLYANEEVSRYLRDHFILHWKSVRPVPKITIDFGDGRKLQRTITGNSIHYVLDADGRVIDALPGLYGPRAFRQGIERAEEITRQCGSLAGEQREQTLRNYHQARLAAIEAAWTTDLTKAKATITVPPLSVGAQPVSLANSPPAAQVAARVAVGKGKVESPILRATLPKTPSNPQELEAASDDASWTKIAALHTEDARLDGTTIALMRTKNPNAFDAGRRTASKMFVEDPLLRTVRNLERSIAEDTVRNEYLFHSKIQAWLVQGKTVGDVEKLNAKVYAELFLTPDSDPWLGLVPRDTYSALENDGLVQSTTR